jgi:arginyl-tRNA synthetase
MIEPYLQSVIAESFFILTGEKLDPREILVETPKSSNFGDFSTNIAMTQAKRLNTNPRKLAEEVVGAIKKRSDVNIARVEIAGSGFINFWISQNWYQDHLKEIISLDENYGKADIGRNRKTQVEFVSANPTGLLHLGHGRQGAIGDTIANLLKWTGYQVTREYYFNNAGRQMRKLAESVYARYEQIFNPDFPLPEDGYQGEYIKDIAQNIYHEKKDSLRNSTDLTFFKNYAENEIFNYIKQSLSKMGIHFDVFYNEDSLYSSGKLQETIDLLRAKDLVYEKEGATWFRTSMLGQEQDRVIVKSTGEPTYRMPDIAYHREKFERGFDYIIDVFGADHIATFPDVLAGINALGYDVSKVRIVIHQFVTLLRQGEVVKMSKRTADVVTLDELMDEVGPDVVRYFFLMRHHNSHLNFDLDLAKQQSDENPVYYVQYAHARISSIIHFAGTQGVTLNPQADIHLLEKTEEIDLMKHLEQFPKVVMESAAALEPHRIPQYLQDAATAFHKFYHTCRVVSPDQPVKLSEARLYLCKAAQIVLRNGSQIIGISQPEKM